MKVSLAVNEFSLGALCITVASSVFGTSLVVVVLGETAIRVHLNEVKGTIETARQIRHVDVEGELLVPKIERLVVGVVGHKIHARANVGGVMVTRYELDGEFTTSGCDPVRASVVATFQCAVLGAGYGVRTHRRVPCATCVAACAACRVQRTPCRVDGNGCRQSMTATARCTLLNAEVGVNLLRLRADLLTMHNSEVDRQQSNHVVHNR